MKKAFTLIELLIVIIIMGVVYRLAINNFAKLSDESQKLTLQNLREYLNSLPHAKSVKLLCLDDCEECSIYIDGVKNKEIDGFLDHSVRSYRYEFSYGFVETQKEVVFDKHDVQKDVCFSYKIDKKGVGDQVLVEYKDGFYDLGAYIQKTPYYTSMQEVVDAKEALIQKVMR